MLDIKVNQPPASARNRKSPRQKRRQSARPQTTRSFDQTILQYKFSYNNNDFGRDAPKITIGMSRPNQRPSVFNPGPGQYDPPRQPISHRLQTQFPKAKQRKNFETITSEIDYIDNSIFPQHRSASIGKRDNHSLFQIYQTPAPDYLPKRQIEVSHKIQGRHQSKMREQGPPPGAYDPNPEIRYCTHYHQLVPYSQNRTSWMISESHPSAAEYTPDKTRILPKEPEFTIGHRSRRRRNRTKAHTQVIGIDIFHIRIGPPFDIDDALDYIRSHPQLKSVLHDVIEEVMAEKPISPVGYIRDYFLEEKRLRMESLPKDDPINCYSSLYEF